jgi:aspartate aminotransferase
MSRYSERIGAIIPSATLGVTSKAKAMKQKGEDVAVLAAGEPDFDTPDIIKEAAIRAIREGKTKYTPSSGTVTLKEAICSKFLRDNSIKYVPENIVVSNGAKHSLYNALQVICNPGDEILIVQPYWLSYPEMAKLAGAVPKIIKPGSNSGFRASAEDVKKNITDRTKVLIINSPSNPAGVVYDEAELRAIAEVCLKKGIIMLSDEIYEKIVFDGRKHFSVASISDEAKAMTIVVNGVSKSYSMTGWRIGYLACEPKLAKMMATLQDHSTSNPCSISQFAAECALTADLDGEMAKNLGIFQKRRDSLLEFLAGEPKLKPFSPGGAFYLFCDISSCGLDSMEFAERLLEEKKVAVIPGGPFGEDGYIRISFATDLGTIEKGVRRVKEFVNSL